MKRLLELRRKKAELVDQIRAVLDKAAAENRSLTTEESGQYDALMSQVDGLQTDIEREERVATLETETRTPHTEPTRPGVGTGVTRMFERAEDKPWGYDTLNATEEEFVRSNPRVLMIRGERRDAHIMYRETAFGEYLQGVARGDSGLGWDPRFKRSASGANTSVPSEGGVFVEHDMSTMLFDRAVEAAVLAPLCTTIEIGANSDGIDLPYIDETSRVSGSRWGGVQVYWRAEADTVTAAKPKFGELDMRLQELMGLAYATDRLLKDASALASVFTMAFTSEMSFKIDDAIFRGNGAGLPLGIIDSTGPRAQQAKETGQAADTIVVENLQKMWTRVLPRSKSKGVWLINSETTPQLDSLALPVGTGGIEPRIVSYDGTGAVRIKGRSIMEIEQCSALGDEGDIVYADMSEYILIRKGGVQAAESMHVRFLYGENTFRWIYRVNGRPALRSAITPYKTNTSNTQSTFVTLASRA